MVQFIIDIKQFEDMISGPVPVIVDFTAKWYALNTNSI